jgi:hypothetical protein
MSGGKKLKQSMNWKGESPCCNLNLPHFCLEEGISIFFRNNGISSYLPNNKNKTQQNANTD